MGKLNPAAHRMPKGSEFAHAAEELSKAEKFLEQAIQPELLPALKHPTDAEAELDRLTAEEFYIDGFRTGARFIMDIYDNTCENPEPIKA